MSDFGNTTYPVARKAYRCEWCYEPILQAEKHVHYVGVWQGDWQDWRMHNECYDDCLEGDPYNDGFSPGENERPKVVAI